MTSSAGAAMGQNTNVLALSRETTVQVTSKSMPSGSGVFVGEQVVLTCFHVVAALAADGPNVKWSLLPDLQVILPSGEKIDATVFSVPTPGDPTPFSFDFAFMKLKTKPAAKVSVAQLASDKEVFGIGDDVVFSGFPLEAPGMVTHKGMVSGFDPTGSVIFVQASVNKGNSGGALFNSSGHVIGLISNREGGLSTGLNDLRVYIDKTSSHGGVQIMGVDPLQATKAIIDTLDRYISTGIGYARAIKFSRSFRAAHPALFK
jgi:S1-C subfamily serine protease